MKKIKTGKPLSERESESLNLYLNEIGADKDVIVPRGAVATYDAPNHERGYYDECALNLMQNAGILVI